MKISCVDIQNYRKLKCCHISFSDKETVFVGANNSGKTSAMDALICFLDHNGDAGSKRKISTTDFTLDNWSTLNSFGKSWENPDSSSSKGNVLSDWQPLCPSLDVWIDIDKEKEVHRVCHLLPTLKWSGKSIGVRLIFQPSDIEKLKAGFLAEYKSAQKTLEKRKDDSNLSLWPNSLRDFLDRKLSDYFKIRAYILDPAKFDNDKNKPQSISEIQKPLENYPFTGLLKVDIIDAQRGFSDPNALHDHTGNNSGNLSALLHRYYLRHLNPSDSPEEKDLDALESINHAKNSFDKKLEESFQKALGEIKGLGYPGFNDPKIRLSCKIEPMESLNHAAAVQFDLQRNEEKNNETLLALPEKYNGLGYKNLIDMVFRLIGFRDQWMREGKAEKRRTEKDASIEPLHLVFIEEPEAHLHAQVQQVFIRKAYEVLQNHDELKANHKFVTQLVVSTHSSCIAHEVGFEKLRYFKRTPASSFCCIPIAETVDLSKTFGSRDKKTAEVEQTAKFVARYLKTTHFDLFFANGIILVEVAAERILLPHFIRNKYDDPKKGLNRNYISILEVGGAHAHRLRPLIKELGVPTLVITDTDAVDSVSGTNKNGKNITTKKPVLPARNKNYSSNNDTIKDWFGLNGKSLDEVLDFPCQDKVKDNVRVAYQYGIQVNFNEITHEAIPYTFEDAMALSNI